MDGSTRGFPGLPYLPEFAQTHVHGVSDAVQLSHPVSPFSSCQSPNLGKTHSERVSHLEEHRENRVGLLTMSGTQTARPGSASCLVTLLVAFPKSFNTLLLPPYNP